ncbi:MAG TPA: hypothetical protein VKU61_15825 [Candidatus Binatia bacterium]|nr:hypothetical protein [Candidatus Binatia bacterium]
MDAFRPSFVPPVGLEFRREDGHVIAFLKSHPEYEAVEAFVSRPPGAPPLLRAILTRHDKTQVDHVSDPAVAHVGRAFMPSRSIVSTDVEYDEATHDGRLHARLAFTSFRGKRVVLELAAATPATPAFGGLTDPEGHAPEVLPIMWRDASAIAGAGTRCSIDDVPCEIAPFGGGVKAFHTVGFALGVVVSREIALHVIESPRALVAGARWRFRRDDDELVYEIMDALPARVVIRGMTAGETIDALVRDGRLAPTAVTIPSGSARPGELAVRFAPFLHGGARFAVDVDAHRDLLTGDIAGTAADFVAHPDAPSWARSRAVHVRLRGSAEEVRIATAVHRVDAAGPTC